MAGASQRKVPAAAFARQRLRCKVQELEDVTHLAPAHDARGVKEAGTAITNALATVTGSAVSGHSANAGVALSAQPSLYVHCAIAQRQFASPVSIIKVVYTSVAVAAVIAAAAGTGIAVTASAA